MAKAAFAVAGNVGRVSALPQGLLQEMAVSRVVSITIHAWEPRYGLGNAEPACGGSRSLSKKSRRGDLFGLVKQTAHLGISFTLEGVSALLQLDRNEARLGAGLTRIRTGLAAQLGSLLDTGGEVSWGLTARSLIAGSHRPTLCLWQRRRRLSTLVTTTPSLLAPVPEPAQSQLVHLVACGSMPACRTRPWPTPSRGELAELDGLRTAPSGRAGCSRSTLALGA